MRGQFFPHAIATDVDDGNAQGDHQTGDSWGASSGGQHSVAVGGSKSAAAGNRSVTVHSPTTTVQSATPQNSAQGSWWNQVAMVLDDNDDLEDEP